MDKSHHFEKTGSHLERKNAENDSPAPATDAGAIAMFMPKKDLLAIYELLFREGLVVPSRMFKGLKTPSWQNRMCLVLS